MTASEPAGDFDYDTHVTSYTSFRTAEPRIEAVVHAALGSSRSVLNVGADHGVLRTP